MRFLIRFSYDGTNFKGYQKQEGYRTIQGELESALYKINNNTKVKIVAAGRTDKGVHAIDQVAHLDLDVDITPYKLKRALNSYLPDEIHINSAMEVPDDYFVRYHVLRKEYHYYINMKEFNPMMRNYIYQHGHLLNVSRMRKAIHFFEGEHDFRAFVTENNVKENCVRTIYEASITRKNDVLDIKFVGSGFLRYQVRNMVGALLKATARSCGLYLVKTTLESDI